MSKLKDKLSNVFKEQFESKKNSLKKFVSENKNKKDLVYQKNII